MSEKREQLSSRKSFLSKPGTCAEFRRSNFPTDGTAQERKERACSRKGKEGRRPRPSKGCKLHIISFPPLGAECWSAFSGSERARAFSVSVSVVEPSSFREQLFEGCCFLLFIVEAKAIFLAVRAVLTVLAF